MHKKCNKNVHVIIHAYTPADTHTHTHTHIHTHATSSSLVLTNTYTHTHTHTHTQRDGGQSHPDHKWVPRSFIMMTINIVANISQRNHPITHHGPVQGGPWQRLPLREEHTALSYLT